VFEFLTLGPKVRHVPFSNFRVFWLSAGPTREYAYIATISSLIDFWVWLLTCAKPSDGVAGLPGTLNPQVELLGFELETVVVPGSGLGLGFLDIVWLANAGCRFAICKMFCILLSR
jgi:hypothetical protein